MALGHILDFNTFILDPAFMREGYILFVSLYVTFHSGGIADLQR